MKLGIILETKEPEKAWNAFRFANASLKRQHAVQVFLMGRLLNVKKLTTRNTTLQQKWNTLLSLMECYMRVEPV